MIHEIRGYRNRACLTLCFLSNMPYEIPKNYLCLYINLNTTIPTQWFLSILCNFQNLFSATMNDKSVLIYKLFVIRFSDIYWYSHLDIAQIDMLAREKNLFNIISTASIQGIKHNTYVILQTLFFVIFGCFIQRSLFFCVFGCFIQRYIKWQ